MNKPKTCPCDTGLNYQQCCGLYHQNHDAPNALALMRSRYSAYSMANVTYIENTMKGLALQGFNPEEAKQWASSLCWLGLEIIEYSENSVEFIARFMIKDSIQAIHERSDFECIDGKWFYIGGIKPKNQHTPQTIKIARNAPCPCGSEKKFKNCHGKSHTAR